MLPLRVLSAFRSVSTPRPRSHRGWGVVIAAPFPSPHLTSRVICRDQNTVSVCGCLFEEKPGLQNAEGRRWEGAAISQGTAIFYYSSLQNGRPFFTEFVPVLRGKTVFSEALFR